MSTRVPQRELKEQQKRVVELADTARANLTAHARSTDELRELGLMLGLIEVGPTGSLVTAYPLGTRQCCCRRWSRPVLEPVPEVTPAAAVERPRAWVAGGVRGVASPQAPDSGA